MIDTVEDGAEATRREGSAGEIVLDGALIAGYALVAGGLLIGEVVTGPVGVLVAAPLVGFLPGYALLSALCPTDDRETTATLFSERLRTPGLAWFERCSLSVPASIAVLPLFVLLLSVSGVPLWGREPTLALVAAVVTGVGIGVVRRLRLPESQRYAPPVGRWKRELHAAFVGPDDVVDQGLNVLLAVVVVLAVSGMAYGLAAPPNGESYTEASLLTDDGGELVAGNYTSTLVEGESMNTTLSIENQEGGRTEYTVVILLERLRMDGDEAAVLEQRELSRSSFSVADRKSVV